MKALFLLTVSLGVCLARYVHPYVDKISDEIDSQEHGVGPALGQTSCQCGWANRMTGRVVGGRETEVNQFPWTVGISYRRYVFIFCGGSIITPFHVLTAAHCVYDDLASRLAVVVGEHDVLSTTETDATKLIFVEDMKAHEKYNPNTENNDIALLTLETKIQFTSKVGPACMPSARNEFNLVDKYVKVIGWGRTMTDGQQSDVLLHTNLRVIPLEHCKKSFRQLISITEPTQMCTFSKKRDACQGDSGGPIVYLDPSTNRYTLVGIVSYGAECGEVTPGVNTEVAAYLDWVQQNIQRTRPKANTCKKI